MGIFVPVANMTSVVTAGQGIPGGKIARIEDGSRMRVIA